MAKISSAESQIMEALWSRGALTPDEVVAEVGPANGWARNTVRVIITRLLNKGAISSAKEEDGRFLYRPVLARSAYVQAESQGLLDRLFEGKLAPLVAHFAEHRQLTAEDVATLKALIAEIDDDRN
ncbi:MAG TPA: BlaI/MecI/CopY family transcriptional regulator [Caulobacteraceae bacterium]